MKKLQRDVSLTIKMVGSIDDEDRIANKEELGIVLSKLITGLSEDIKEVTVTDVKDEVMDSKTYMDGLKDAWNIAAIISSMNQTKLREVFGRDDYSVDMALTEFTAKEAIDKIVSHEKECEIKVGDVVTTPNGVAEYLVLRVENNQGAKVLHLCNRNNGTVQTMTGEVKKTGKHIDVKNILKQISED